MLPSDDFSFLTKIEITRQSIERSRQQVFGSNHVDQRAEPNDHADLIPSKLHPEPGLNNAFWKEVDLVGDHLKHPAKINHQFPTFNDQKSRPAFEISRKRQIEEFAEKCSNACNFWDAFGQGRRKEMVRVGEFSPQNPSLQTTGRSLLGLGEYEERRRQLLQKKREEYHQELAQIAQVQKSMALQNVSPAKEQKVTKDCSTQTDLSLFSPGQPLLVDVQSSTAQTKPSALFDVQTTAPSLPLPQVSGLSIFTPRSQSPSSPDKRTLDLTVPDNLLLIGGGLSDARLRQLRHQEDLRRQIEEKQRLEAERKEKEAREEEALLRRVAEQQARLQAEYEEEERLRRQKELEKKFQTEEFLRRQEQLLLESEQLKQETRRKRMEALNALADPQPLPPAPLLSNQKLSEQQSTVENAPAPQEQAVEEQTKERKKEKKTTGKERPGRNALSVPAGPAAPISILKSVSPPPRSPREAPVVRADEPLDQPSPRALIKVLEGPTYRRRPRNQIALEDSLPIPLLREARTTPSQRFPPVQTTRSNPNSAVIQPSEAMQRLEDKWKVPAVQKNVMTKRKVGQWGDSSQSHVVLTQLGSFRRQLQEEHMRMQEQMRDFKRQPKPDEKMGDMQAVS